MLGTLRILCPIGLLLASGTPVLAACLQPANLNGFADCLSASIAYQLNEGAGISVEQATREAVTFCYPRNAQ